MYTDILQKIGLAKNEARIYETLLREGESPVGVISKKSNVHRRNVYDSLNRLIEKGLAFEIVESRENYYRAVDPDKLSDILDEQRGQLDKIMPDLQAFYTGNPSDYSIYTYRGKEGWKNYMRDILRINEPAYFIAAKGGWLDERVKDYFPQFIEQAKKQKIEFYHLFDWSVQHEVPEIIPHVGPNFKFLPENYHTPSGVDIFGNQVNFITEMTPGRGLDQDMVVSVIVNQQLADSFRTWFQFMWDSLPENS